MRERVRRPGDPVISESRDVVALTRMELEVRRMLEGHRQRVQARERNWFTAACVLAMVIIIGGLGGWIYHKAQLDVIDRKIDELSYEQNEQDHVIEGLRQQLRTITATRPQF